MAFDYAMLDGARDDFESILSYLLTVSESSTAAASFVEEYEKQVSRICENPKLHGLSRMPELAALGYRAALIRNYTMLYFFRDGTVFIAHIFHQRQDYARLI